VTTNNVLPEHRLRSAYEGRKAEAFDEGAEIATPLELHRCTVKSEWVDYNGHMSESCYLLAFGDNSDAFFRYFGIDDDYRAHGYSIYSLETHLRHVREAALGEPLRLTLHLLDCDHKRLHLFHQMYRASDQALLATAEQLLIHVDMQAARAAPFPADLQRRLASIRFAHAQAPGQDDARRTFAIGRHPAPVDAGISTPRPRTP
jgi:acyl-CoA thioester hydrolase